MIERVDSYGVSGTDDVRNDETSAADAELDELRARQRELREEYLKNPWDLAAQGALVRVEQRMRHLEESRQLIAANGAGAPPLDAGEHARHGERWAVGPSGWSQAPAATSSDTLDVATPVAAFTDAARIKKQIALHEIAIGYGHPELIFRLGELKRRLSDVQAHQPPAKPPVTVPHPPAAPLGHGDCATPRPIAMPGNAKRIADAGVDLEASLQGATHLTTPELARYIDDYIAYTATKPELRALHDRAVTRGAVILADRLDADDAARERALMEAHVEDQKRLMVVRPPLPIQQRAAVGEIAIPIAKTVDAIAKLTPVVGELLFALETATGHEMAGLGPKMDDGERAFNAVLLLAPFAAQVLVGGVREAAALVRIARATGKTPEQVRMILISARDLEKQRALVIGAFEAKKTGRALTPVQEAAVARARVLVADFGGVTHAQAQGVLTRAAKDAVYQARIDAGARAYANVVRSNKSWKWGRELPGNFTDVEKRAIKLRAVELGLIERVPFKPGTQFLDFGRIGLIERADQLPKELWLKSDDVQFAWLNARIPGGCPSGYTWHHSEIPGRMELVPFGLHNVNGHIGGRSAGQWANAPR